MTNAVILLLGGYACLWILTSALWDAKAKVKLDDVERTIYLHEDSEWLELLKRVGAHLNKFGRAVRVFRFLRHIDLDVMGQQTAWHIHFDRSLKDVPQEVLFHEVAGHLRRWIKAPHIPLPVIDDATRSATMYFDYLRKPEEDEEEADRLMWECVNNARPRICEFSQETLALFGPPSPRPVAPSPTGEQNPKG